jgi:GT2 family glycosyltransferase/glycosyltransferase involved in cell wall biosynthesis
VKDYWAAVIQPLLEAGRARTIVEIGAERGILTRELAAFARAHGGVLHSVDPAPLFDVNSYEKEFGAAFEFHRALSLDALPQIGPVDMALIDGDHNWFTVLAELRLLRDGGTFPIALLHDIAWPYGRRDLYYNPETIPEEARQPHGRGGLLPGVGGLTADGFNSHLAHAELEGGPRNGVLTAVEDFLVETGFPLRFLQLQGLHGLGILIAEELLEERRRLRGAVRRIESKAFARDLTGIVEEERLTAALAVQRQRRELERAEQAQEDLGAVARQLLEAETQLAGERASGKKQGGELEAVRHEAAALAGELAVAEDRLVSMATAEIDLRRRLARQEEQLQAERSAHGKAREELTRMSETGRRLRTELAAAQERAGEQEEENERLRAALSAHRRELAAQRIAAAQFAERLAAEREELAGAAHRLARSRSWRFGHGLFLALRRLWPGRTRTESALDLIVERLERPLAPPDDPAPPSPGPSAVARRRLDAGVLARLAAAPQVTIVIPVHNAAAQVRRCLEALARNTPAPAEALIVDDASTDDDTVALLRRYAALSGIRLVRNEVNQGFTRTVNRGLAETDGDVVLLNSDTEVGPRWLESLRLTAYSAADIGTVTPLSDNAGAFSAPVLGEANETPPGLGVDEVARLVAQGSRRITPATPTGSGFCLYMKREMIAAVGELDADSFPRGYGEENDYCMRAGAAGWRHVVDDATFVRHEREASFGAEKAELSRAGRKAVDSLHPSYTSEVRRFVRSAEMEEARSAVRFAFAHHAGAAPRPRLLFVVHEGGGGTPATNADLIGALEADYDCFVLTSNSQTVRLRHYAAGTDREVDAWELKEQWRPTEFSRADFAEIALDVLSGYAIELVHIRHLFKHTLDLPRAAQAMGIPVVVSLHDFYLACPTVHLLDDQDRYCGGTCTPGSGSCRQPSALLRETPPLKHAWVHTWREEVGTVLRDASALVTTSPHAREVYERAYPDLSAPFELIEHGRDFAARGEVAQWPEPGQPLRILVAGSLEFHKGSSYLARLKELDGEGRLELHFLGPEPPDGVAVPGIHHGPYRREEFAARAAALRPAMVGIFSVCPETYCHVLTEAWAAGIPAIATDIGALGERLRRHGGGWLVPHDDPDAAYERIVGLLADENAFSVAMGEVGAIELRDTAAMGRDYDALYRRVLQARRAIAAEADTPETATLTRRVIRLSACVPGERGTEPGSSHVRVLTRLSHPAIATKVQAHFPGPDRLLGNGERPDAVLVQRTAMPPAAVPELLDRAGSTGTPLIVELDDDLLALDGDPEYGRHVEAIRALVGEATVVTVSTPALAASLADLARKVTVIRNALDERLWFGPLPADVEPAPADRGGAAVRVLYMGTSTHAGDLALLKPVLSRLRDDAGLDVRLEVIGGEIPGAGQDWYERLAVPSGNSVYPRFVRWLRSQAGRWDIAVAPLVDDDFNRSKSDLKFLEYAALGLPTVVSDVEAYRDVRHDVDGLKVADDPQAWCEALLSLGADADLRGRLAQAASEQVRANRCLEVEVGRYLSVLCDAVESRA